MPNVALSQPQSDMYHMMTDKDHASLFNLMVAGYGAGKSETMVIVALALIMAFPGANIGVYSPTYDLLRLILLPRIEAYLTGMGIKYTLNKTEMILTVQGYGMFILRSLDKPDRIIGYETFASLVDELDTLVPAKAEQAWLKLIARNRQQVELFPNWPNKVGVFTTPEGFGFTYRYWSENGEVRRQMSQTEKDLYHYIRAPSYSNPYVTEQYLNSLRATYPAHLVECYIEGIWTNLNTGLVYPNYDKKLNDCNTVLVPTDQKIYVGMDFNVQRGCSTVHVDTPIEENDPNYFKGAKYTDAIAEVYNAYDTIDQANILREMFPKKDYPNMIIYPDASGKHRHSSNATHSDFAVLEKKDYAFKVRKYNYNGLVKDRVMSLNSRIKDGRGRRLYRVNSQACPNLAAALETQTYDVNGQPSKGSPNYDDINDSAGYVTARRFPIVKPKSGVKQVRGNH